MIFRLEPLYLHMTSSHLPFKLKLSYGIADLGASLAYVTINIFLLKFLVDVVGLNPRLAGLAFLVGRVIDAVTDPLMGIISDKFQSRWGRRMPFIWAGIIPIGLSFALLWILPSLAAFENQMQLFALTCLLLSFHAIAYTIVQVPYLALTPELAPEYSQRTVLSSFRAGFGTFASMIASAGPPLVVALFAVQNDLRGWAAMGIIFGGIISLSYLIMALGIQPYAVGASGAFREGQGGARAPSQLKPQAQTNPSIWQSYTSAFAAHGFTTIFMLFVVVTIAFGITSAVLPFYLEHGFGLTGINQTVPMAILFGVAILSLLLWTFISGQLGKRSAFAIGLLILGVALPLLVFLSPYGGLSAQLVGFSSLAGIGLGAAMLFPWAMLPDVADFDEQESGERREGLLYAIFTFGQKLAVALGAFTIGQMLAAVGYVEGASSQTVTAVNGIRFFMGVVAPCVFLAALYFIWRYPITRQAHSDFMSKR